MLKNSLAIFFLFLFSFSSLRASASTVLINEIAWMGTEVSSTDEWIELSNSTASDIDIGGWSLLARDGQPNITLQGFIPAEGYFLLERTDDDTIPNKIASQIYSGSLGNTGEYLELFDNEKNLIDFVEMTDAWVFGDNLSKQTMERVDQNNWQTSLNSGGTPGDTNSVVNNISANPEIIIEEDLEPENVLNVNYKYADILINELVSDPADGDSEWIELFNNTGQNIDLTDWYIKDGSGSKTILGGDLLASDYFVVESPKGNLNNSGDEILLFSPLNKLISSLVYGDWNDGDISDNAPLANDPASIARINKIDTLNNKNDFKLTNSPSKGGANIIANEEDINIEEITDYDFGETVIISEVFPNPIGDDNEEEFIELYNYGDRDINLFGWELGDSSKKRFQFKRGDSIGGKSYLVLFRGDTGIALNNTGDLVNIFLPGSEEAIYSLKYEKGEEGFSFNNSKTEETLNFYNKNFIKSNWVWSETPSPGEKNLFSKINHFPEVDFSFSDELFVGVPVLFDSSDSFDEDGDELIYRWDFGDGFQNILPNPEHTFFQSGVFSVFLTIDDGESSSTKEKILTLRDRVSFDNLPADNSDVVKIGETKIFITKILPNPDGDDLEGEFVEIYNAGDFEVNLFDWSLDDMDGGSKPYKISSNQIVEPGAYFIINRTESGVVLNNTYDEVRLIDAKDNIVDEIKYKTTFNGKTYAKDENGDWVWADVASPGEEMNSPVYSQSENFTDGIEIGEGLDYFSFKTPREVQDHGAEQRVLVEGVVNSLPGMFSSQYFYIEGDGGVQVYSNSKDFPELAIGDFVQVRGEISKINLESRIKTKTKDEIFKVDSEYILTPLIPDGDLSKEYLGRLVSLKGEVIEKNDAKFVLETENANYNLEIKDGVNIDKKTISEGAKLSIVGVVSSNKNGFVVLPRFTSDIEFIEDYKTSDAGEVLGEFGTSSEWSLEQKNSNKNNYLILIILGFLAAGGILIYKKKTHA